MFGEQVGGDADRVGDDGEGWVDGTGGGEAGGVDDVEVVEIVGLAVGVEDAGVGVVAHATGAVLVADAFERDALLEVGMKRNRGVGVAGLLEDIDPASFEAVEGLDVVGSVGEPDFVRGGDLREGGFVDETGVSGAVRAGEAGGFGEGGG